MTEFTPFFKRYEELSAKAGSAFKRVAAEYPECIKCRVGCSDCCHALFDLTFIEALYINHQFNENFNGQEREAIIEKANKTDRTIYKIKRDAYKALEAGKDENEILTEMARERVRCPLLNEKDECDLYAYRPITCKLYGIPTAIGGKGHTCGESGFMEGKSYPTVNLDIIHDELYKISDELVKAIQSKYIKMGDMLVPLSMALLTVYDDEHLGLLPDDDTDNEKGAKNE